MLRRFGRIPELVLSKVIGGVFLWDRGSTSTKYLKTAAAFDTKKMLDPHDYYIVVVHSTNKFAHFHLIPRPYWLFLIILGGAPLLCKVRRIITRYLCFVSGGCHHPIFWLFFFWVKMRELLLCRYPLPDFSIRWKTRRYFLLCVLIRKLIPTCLRSGTRS